jgi:hypothetical protein
MRKLVLAALTILVGCTWNDPNALSSNDPNTPSSKAYEAYFGIHDPKNFCWEGIMSIPTPEDTPPLGALEYAKSERIQGCGDKSFYFDLEGVVEQFFASVRVDFDPDKCDDSNSDVTFSLIMFVNGEVADEQVSTQCWGNENFSFSIPNP